jgi:hypothetical protein
MSRQIHLAHIVRACVRLYLFLIKSRTVVSKSEVENTHDTCPQVLLESCVFQTHGFSALLDLEISSSLTMRGCVLSNFVAVNQ